MKRLLLNSMLFMLGAVAQAGDLPGRVYVTVDGVGGATIRCFNGQGTHNLLSMATIFPTSFRTEMRMLAVNYAKFAGLILMPKNTMGIPQVFLVDAFNYQFEDALSVSGFDPNHGVFGTVITGGKPDDFFVAGEDQGYLVASFKGDSFDAYPTSFHGGVRVAAGDLTGDGIDDLIVGPGPGALLPVYARDSGSEELIGLLYPYGRTYRGGVFVAAGDLNGDGTAEIVVSPDAGMAPQVKVFSADGTLMKSFYAYETSFKGGVRLSVADLDNDGKAEIITGNGPGRNPQIRVFDLAHGLLWSKSFMPSTNRSGIQVSGVGPF